jgi:hypothetical protein
VFDAATGAVGGIEEHGRSGRRIGHSSTADAAKWRLGSNIKSRSPSRHQPIATIADDLK